MSVHSLSPLVEYLSERDLITQLKKKNKIAFGYLYDKYAAALYGVLVRIVDDEHLCKDLLHDVFIKIWKKIPSYDATKSSLYTWLASICRNHAIDTIRSATYKRTVNAKNLLVTSDPNSSFINGHKIDLVRKVNRLKKRYKTVIVLCYFEGYTEQQVACLLRMPLGSVKSCKRNALKEMRSFME